MSRAIHEEALAVGYEPAVADGLDSRIVGNYLRALREGECPEWLESFLFQKNNGGPNIFDAYALYLVCAWAEAGWLAFYSVPVGVGPAADRMVDENNERLRRLPDEFSAVFRPELRVGDCDDGRLEWSLPLRFLTHEQSPGRVPLEVGTTAASRTIVHLRKDGGLARWAYDSESIVIGVITPAGREALGVLGVVSRDVARCSERAGQRLEEALGVVMGPGLTSTRERRVCALLAAACDDLGLTVATGGAS